MDAIDGTTISSRGRECTVALNLVESRTLYTGRRMRLDLLQFRDDDGRKHVKEIVVHPGAVIVLPLLDDGRVVLIRNRRWALREVLYELPAGTLEKGETPINCAGRELLEEAGYLATRLRPLLSFYTSPGILSEKMHAFLAEGLQPKQTAHELDEEIEVAATPLDHAIRMIRDGEILDGKTIATLLFYERFGR